MTKLKASNEFKDLQNVLEAEYVNERVQNKFSFNFETFEEHVKKG